MIVKQVPKELIKQVWSQASAYINNALEFADEDYSLDDVKNYLISGQWSLLIVIDDDNKLRGAITVAYAKYPNNKVAYITAIGGKWISDKESYKNFVNVLKDNGATKIQGAARESVARLWRRLGFREKHIIVERSI
jgi:hypothetical protein